MKSLKYHTKTSVLKNGLDQIPDEGLQRLVEHIQDGKPVLKNGNIIKEGVY